MKLVRNPDWRDDAACRTADPDLFFPDGGTGPWRATIAEAKAVCQRCPVIDDCLRHAFNQGEQYGIYGGLTHHERRAARRRATRPSRAPKPADTTPVDEGIKAARTPKTLGQAWQARTTPLGGGHLGWTGNKTLYFQGTSYTPKRAAWIADRGQQPHGHIESLCDVPQCVTPGHLADARERDERGLTGRPRRAAA